MVHAAGKVLAGAGIKVVRHLTGSYVTSLEMAGCSIKAIEPTPKFSALRRGHGHISGIEVIPKLADEVEGVRAIEDPSGAEVPEKLFRKSFLCQTYQPSGRSARIKPSRARHSDRRSVYSGGVRNSHERMVKRARVAFRGRAGELTAATANGVLRRWFAYPVRRKASWRYRCLGRVGG